VVGVDRDPAVLDAVAAAHPTEPGLDDALRAVLASGRLRTATAPSSADVYVVCVGTPLAADGSADLRDVDAAVEAIAAVMPGDALVVVESTVPVGTTDAIAARLRARAPGARVAACPERVLPGDALREVVENPRLAGGVDEASAAAAAEWLATFVTGRVDRTDARTAELAKLVENASRDVDVALANAVAAVAERFGVDPYELRALVNRHPRVRLAVPGVGVGGHCLPVDPWFLVRAAPAETTLLAEARRVNDAVPARWVDRILARAGGRPIGLLGLTYKADVDDFRGSPALEIARALSRRADVLAHDPYAAAVDGVALGRVEDVLARPVVALLVAHRAYEGLPVTLDCCGGRA
jgi:UDP-N-acetyl-D-mannosaminuronic acid dehydrogenase